MHKFSWDTQYSFKLKTQLMKYGRLDGFGAVENDKPIGFVYWHRFESELYLSGFYFSQLASIQNQLSFINHIANYIVENNSTAIVEGQLLGIDEPVKSEPFDRNGFITVLREYMLKDLSIVSENITAGTLREGWKMNEFSSVSFDNLDDIADSMHKSYKGTIDEWITRSFGSFRGCRNFIANLNEFPIYGKLLEKFSLTLTDDKNQIAAMILVCKSSNTTAHLVQVSVIPEYQSKGIGKFLLSECLKKLSSAGYKKVVLMVTAQNTKAYNLYRKTGFETLSTFYSINYNKIKTPPVGGVR